ncbi:hypothetical protein V7139_29840 [Neobacillus drentensis]
MRDQAAIPVFLETELYYSIIGIFKLWGKIPRTVSFFIEKLLFLKGGRYIKMELLDKY